VGWRTQDADSARVRDELRQAARTWDEHDRSDDLLWTGSAYREFSLWRERYPGGLSELEEAFAWEMTALATRRSRRRRIAVGSAFVTLLLVLAVVGSFWRRSVLETRRAEASKLVALAQVQLETDPTEALAYATASLELADSSAARSFVMRTLWEAPPALAFESRDTIRSFSPAGGWVAVAGLGDVAEVWSDAGDGPIVLRGLDANPACGNGVGWISESLLLTGAGADCFLAERVRIWSVPDAHVVRTIEFGARSWWQVEGQRLFVETAASDPAHEGELLLRSWRLPEGEPEDLGWVKPKALIDSRWIDSKGQGVSSSLFDHSGNAWIYVKDRTIFARPLPVTKGARDRVVGTHRADDIQLLVFASNGDQIVSVDGEGELRVWSLSAPGAGPVRVIPRPQGAAAPYVPVPDHTRRWVRRGMTHEIGKGLLWDLWAVPGARPLELRRSGSWMLSSSAFHPRGEWLATSTQGGTEVSFWPLRRAYPSIVEGAGFIRKGLAFSPDGRWLATTWPPLPGQARLFPLPYPERTEVPNVGEHTLFSNLVFDRAGTRLAGGHYGPLLSVVPLGGGEPQMLEGFERDTLIEAVAFSPSGRLIAAASGISFDEKMLRVWNLDTGEVQAFELPRTDTSMITGYPGYLDNVQNLWFTDEHTLITVGATRFLRWNLEAGSHEEIVDLGAVIYRTAAASADVRKVLIIENPEGHEGDICATPELYDLAAGTVEALPSFGDCVRVIALDPSGTIAVTGDNEGIIRVGRVTGGEPHLLVGHEGAVEYVAVSPDLEYVASVGSDSTLRLWPMPDLSKPPLHTLPHDELIAKLETLTNLRAVRDEESVTGWTIEIGPFPGWKTIPEW
jgi:WD40 repeat protein